MKVQINVDPYWIKYILKHNLSEKVSPYISLGEVLMWLAEHPESLEEPVCLWTGDKDVGIALEMNMNHEDDTYYVSVYDVVSTIGLFDK